MTKSAGLESDKKNTALLLKQVSSGQQVAALHKSWLGHTKGAGQLDFMLLRGISMTSMLVHRGAVKEHFRHLNKEHGLKVVEINGVYKLVVPLSEH